jgi:hypothetical protein
MTSSELLSEEAVRSDALELLVGLLFADWTVSRAAAETLQEGVAFLTPVEIAEVVRMIESVVLGGVEADGMVKQLSANIDTLQNYAHTIRRYRYRSPRR